MNVQFDFYLLFITYIIYAKENACQMKIGFNIQPYARYIYTYIYIYLET